jgi:Flp pilus assembly pilin Flp
MTNLLSQLWDDDQGAIISVEWLLIVGILIFGLIPGFVALRNSIDASLATIGNILSRVIPNFTYSGFQIGGNNPIAAVGGYSFTPTTVTALTSQQLTPVILGPNLVVSPAP